MRAATHVEPCALAARFARPIDRQIFALGQFLGPFSLEIFTFGPPFGDQIITRPHFANQRLVRFNNLAHLLFDRGQVFQTERLTRGGCHHVIVEPVIGCRAKSDLRARPQSLHRFGQDMGVVMAHQFERIALVARGDQCQLSIAVERTRHIAHFAVHTRCQRGFGQARTNRRGHVSRGRPRRHFAHRAIRQVDFEQFGHSRHPLVWRALGQDGAHRKSGVEFAAISGGHRAARNPGGVCCGLTQTHPPPENRGGSRGQHLCHAGDIGRQG